MKIFDINAVRDWCLGKFAKKEEVPTKISELINDKGFLDGDISDSTSEFEESEDRENIQSGEQAKTLFGKIKKWLSDLKPVAFTGSFDDLSDKPTAETLGAVKKDGDTMTGELETPSIKTSVIKPVNKVLGSNPIELKINDRGDSAIIEKKYGNIIKPTPILAESDILTTEEEIDANTDIKMVAGATAIKSLKINLANSVSQINSNLNEAKLATDIRFLTDNMGSNCLSYIIATTEELKNLALNKAYFYKVFAFADITVPCVGISFPIKLPTTGQSGYIQICSKFDGLGDVYARKLLDGRYYGEW